MLTLALLPALLGAGLALSGVHVHPLAAAGFYGAGILAMALACFGLAALLAVFDRRRLKLLFWSHTFNSDEPPETGPPVEKTQRGGEGEPECGREEQHR